MTTDAGFKSFATDAGPPVIARRAAGRGLFLLRRRAGRRDLFRGDGKLEPGDVMPASFRTAIPRSISTTAITWCAATAGSDLAVDARGRSA